MRLTAKDRVGLAMVLVTSVALVMHRLPVHRATHRGAVADAGGAITSALESVSFAFYDVNVVPMERDGVVLRHQVVVVRDGFVSRIGDVAVVEPPDGARIIDGGGTRYLVPGLTDAHVHLGDRPEALLPLFLANGVTTVFNLEGTPQHLALRDRVRAGEVVGPTIYTAGPFADEISVRTPADARNLVLRQKRRGYDFVKLHGNLSATTYEMLTGVARDEGIPVLGHAPRNLPLSAVLDNGQVDLSHAEDLIYTQLMTLDTSEIDPVARRVAEAGTWVTPGVSTFENIARQWGDPDAVRAMLERPEVMRLPRSLRRSWAASREYADKDPAGRVRIEQMLAFHEPLVRSLHEAGVPLLAGTDAGIPGMVPGLSLHDEIAALHRVGLSPVEALAAATRDAGRFTARWVDPGARFGTVTVSARADLLLLDGDPRRSLGVLRRPLGVMARGRWYDRSALDGLMESIAQR